MSKAFCLQVASGRKRKIEQERGLRGKSKSEAIREKVDVMNEENGSAGGGGEVCESRGTGRPVWLRNW